MIKQRLVSPIHRYEVCQGIELVVHLGRASVLLDAPEGLVLVDSGESFEHLRGVLKTLIDTGGKGLSAVFCKTPSSEYKTLINDYSARANNPVKIFTEKYLFNCLLSACAPLKELRKGGLYLFQMSGLPIQLMPICSLEGMELAIYLPNKGALVSAHLAVQDHMLDVASLRTTPLEELSQQLLSIESVMALKATSVLSFSSGLLSEADLQQRLRRRRELLLFARGRLLRDLRTHTVRPLLQMDAPYRRLG